MSAPGLLTKLYYYQYIFVTAKAIFCQLQYNWGWNVDGNIFCGDGWGWNGSSAGDGLGWKWD